MMSIGFNIYVVCYMRALYAKNKINTLWAQNRTNVKVTVFSNINTAEREKY